MATRYTDEKKAEVVNFVKDFDAKNGRGGQSAAKKKYKINPISIKKWCVEQGVTGPSKKTKPAAAKPKAKVKAKAKATTGAKRGPKKGSTRGRKPKAAAPAAAKSAAPAARSNASMTAKLKKMGDLSEKIDTLQAQFDELKKSL